VGRVVALAGDTLTIVAEQRFSHPTQVLLDGRSRVDLSVQLGNYLVQGLVIGGVLGAGFGAFVVGANRSLGSVGVAPGEQEEVSKTLIVVGVVVGGALGALIGASVDHDAWMAVKLPGRMSFGSSLDAEGRVRLAILRSF